MKPSLLNKLRCSVCKGHVAAAHFVETENEIDVTPINAEKGDSKVRTGIVICENCKLWFPVINYVPVMLVFETAMTRSFVHKYQKELASYSSYKNPRREPELGEASIQQTFTEEWLQVDTNEFTFSYTPEQNISLQKQVWLHSIDLDRENLEMVLDVGCGGFAAEAVALRNLSSKTEVYAVDLNFAVVKNGHIISREQRVHAVIASLFHLPFERESFDLVFSQGVIHHTYNTRAAFSKISDLSKSGGFLFIWVYALEDPLVNSGWQGVRERLRYWILMVLLRPLVSRLPKILRLAFIFPLAAYNHVRIKATNAKDGTWRFSNTMHGAYDMISPRFAHDHSFNEVIEWFEGERYFVTVHSPRAYRLLFGRALHGIGILGRKLGLAL